MLEDNTEALLSCQANSTCHGRMEYDRLPYMKRLYLIAALTGLFMSSCAYMQTGKNIREAGKQYEGCELTTEDMVLCNSRGSWYLAAPAETFAKSYPVIHDSVLLSGNNEPRYTSIKKNGGLCYMPISDGTAAILQMTDGYARPDDLAIEINRLSATRPITTELPGATRHKIVASLSPAEKPVVITHSCAPEEISLTRRIIAGLDFAVVDIPGTLAYNVAIPVMVPFVFFHDFLKPENW